MDELALLLTPLLDKMTNYNMSKDLHQYDFRRIYAKNFNNFDKMETVSFKI